MLKQFLYTLLPQGAKRCGKYKLIDKVPKFVAITVNKLCGQ